MSHTGTPFSKIIRRHTRFPYNHLSLAVNKDLSVMYSFGRKNPYLFFYGGFVEEGREHGTFKRFKKTCARVYELAITEECYAAILDILKAFLRKKHSYGYNIRGVFRARKDLDEQRSPNRYYCSQFVARVLVKAGVISPTFIKGAPTCEKFLAIEGLRLVYEGNLRDYPIL